MNIKPHLMSITKQSFGKVQDVVIAQFGKGTIEVVFAEKKEFKCLLLKSRAEPAEIGELMQKYKTSDDFKPEIAIVFHNRESFEVFKEMVDRIDEEYEEETLKQ